MQILISIDGPIARISFNRPELRNALSRDMWKALGPTIAAVIDRGARVIIFSGEGGSFAAGADINELGAVNDMADAEDFAQAIADGIEAIAQARATTIAMIDGPCMGGGCLIAAACDLRYATQASIFAVPVARLGIVLDQTNILRLTSLLGPTWVKELLYTGATIDSITAQHIGLIIDYFDTPEELFDHAIERAETIAANSIESILGAKATINSLYNLDRELPAAQRGPTAKEVAASYFSADLKARLAKILQS
ncbi:MAG: enoyl-CoA hydratase/isomerase family protein [Cyanobacteria bacterium REEB67]|nr:enoyl-CoA hydratase/isomerase family protein [Cyanobacteria bacterium REEB67]